MRDAKIYTNLSTVAEERAQALGEKSNCARFDKLESVHKCPRACRGRAKTLHCALLQTLREKGVLCAVFVVPDLL